MTRGPNWQPDVPKDISDISKKAGQHVSADIADADPGSGAWETPIPLRPAAAPPLDVSRLGALAPMASAVATSYQVPVDLPALFGLAAVSTAVGGRRYVCPKPDWSEPVALYTMVICAPGEMKSPTLKAMAAPLYDAEEHQQDEAAPKVEADQQMRRIIEARRANAETRAGKAHGREADVALADAQGELVKLLALGQPLNLPEFFADDATPEALAAKMHEQGGRLAVLSAEGSFLGNTAGRYSDGTANPEIVLKAWSHERHPIDRMGRRLVIKRPSLTVGLAPQPGLLTGLGKNAEVFDERGLFARFLYSLPASRVGTRHYDTTPVPHDVLRDYAHRLTTVIDQIWSDDRYTEMTLDEKAQGSFRDFWTAFEARHRPGGDLTGIEAWAKKFPGQLLRVAALITVLSDPASTTIHGPVMDDVIALAPYFIAHARHAADLMSKGRQTTLGPARDLLTWIHRPDPDGQPKTEFTARDAFNGVRSRTWAVDQDSVNKALAVLEERFYLRRREPEPHAGRGRPKSATYEINPLARPAPTQAPEPE